MVDSIQVLKKSELCGQQFTVYGTPESPLFLAKEVAACIEHSNITVMLQSVDEDEKIKITPKESLGDLVNYKEYNFLTEYGLYEVLMQSRKPIAKQFKKGIKLILHEIRMTGSYSTIDYSYINPDKITRKDLAKMIMESEEDLQAQGKIIAEQKERIRELEEKLDRERAEREETHFRNLEALVEKMVGTMMQGFRTIVTQPASVQPAPEQAEPRQRKYPMAGKKTLHYIGAREKVERRHPGSMLIREMCARLDAEKNLRVTSKELKEWLQKKGYLLVTPDQCNRPSDESIEKGWMDYNTCGNTGAGVKYFTPYITSEGYAMLSAMLLEKGGAI